MIPSAIQTRTQFQNTLLINLKETSLFNNNKKHKPVTWPDASKIHAVNIIVTHIIQFVAIVTTFSSV